MNRKILLPAILILVCSVLISRAQKSRSSIPKNGSTYIRHLSTIKWSSSEDGHTDSGIKLIIVWKGAQPPETFFWRPKNGAWMTCAVTRLHTNPDRTDKLDEPYIKEETDLAQIRKGDTLELSPMRGGRDIMPKTIPASMTNRVFFMMKRNSNWWYTAIPAIPAKKK